MPVPAKKISSAQVIFQKGFSCKDTCRYSKQMLPALFKEQAEPPVYQATR
jgi:hypothetical protein